MTERNPQQIREVTCDVSEARDALRLTVRGLDEYMNHNDRQLREYVAALHCVEAKLSRAEDALQDAVAADTDEFVNRNREGRGND